MMSWILLPRVKSTHRQVQQMSHQRRRRLLRNKTMKCSASFSKTCTSNSKVIAEQPLRPGDDPPGAVRPGSAQEALDGATIQDDGPRRPCGGVVRYREGLLC
ncbi:uncharacterized protein LOC123500154 [Portunus trituberculatus]|uniref:uncharacterized protein LOC123500154 n=1 Tax=Portunus trituberculatus TaxID=210409 RepID=UPI001E1D0622|nr:uncharacterized protein LOC123500154 [Portunus trituberculatus]